VERLFQILVQTDSVFKEFRGRFLGKSSPVHFFWGAFDLAVTRFSGRRAPKREKPEAFRSRELSEFLLPYDAVRAASSPPQMLLEFMESTYAVAAELAHWDRTALERR
jgi:Family of unknown function (DUF5996)